MLLLMPSRVHRLVIGNGSKTNKTATTLLFLGKLIVADVELKLSDQLL